MTQYMCCSVYVSGEPKCIQNVTELLDHGLIRAADVDIKVARQEQTIMRRHKNR